MDVTLLKQMKEGDQIDLGEMFPGVDDTACRWTCTNVIEGTRQVGSGTEKFTVAEFSIDYEGVSLGQVRAHEDGDRISWEAVK